MLGSNQPTEKVTQNSSVDTNVKLEYHAPVGPVELGLGDTETGAGADVEGFSTSFS
jgi:hypothetical protein